jgi:hypothetical protein
MYSEHISDRPIYWTDVKVAARELGISRARVRRLVRRLGINFTYVEDGAPRPHTWLFPRRDLRKLARVIA